MLPEILKSYLIKKLSLKIRRNEVNPIKKPFREFGMAFLKY